MLAYVRSTVVLSIIGARWAVCCRSPVLSSVNEAINGLATIRAFNIGPWLIARNRELVDKNAATSLLNQSLNRWLSVRLEGLGKQGEGLPQKSIAARCMRTMKMPSFQELLHFHRQALQTAHNKCVMCFCCCPRLQVPCAR